MAIHNIRELLAANTKLASCFRYAKAQGLQTIMAHGLSRVGWTFHWHAVIFSPRCRVELEKIMAKYSKPLTPKQIAELDDEDIDFSDIPELDKSFWEEAELVIVDSTE